MAILLTVTDLANGQGATATVAGSQAGSTNTVSVLPYAAGFAAAGWQAVGSRTGDGGLTLAINPGYYWARVDSSAAPYLGNVCQLAVSQAGDSVYWRVLTAVQAFAQQLPLAGLPPAASLPANQVYLQKEFDDTALQMPCVLLLPLHAEKLAAATNLREDVSYPVFTGILDRAGHMDKTRLRLYLAWRQVLARGFRRQRLAQIPEVFDTDLQYQAAIDPKHGLYQYLQSALVFWVKARESRGLP